MKSANWSGEGAGARSSTDVRFQPAMRELAIERKSNVLIITFNR